MRHEKQIMRREKMKIQKITGLAVAAAVMATSMVFVQCGDGAVQNESRQARAKIERVDRETPEMQAKRAQFYQTRIGKINQAVQDGKLEQVRADLILKWMAHDNAFKDANPEWTKYLFAGKRFDGKCENGKKFEGKGKDGRKFEGVKGETIGQWKKEGKAGIERPKREGVKGNPAEMYQGFVDMINQKVKSGTMEQAHADFMLKWMASNKAFMDANPAWAEAGLMGKGFHGKKNGDKGERGSKTR
jgi:hypothetical protein